MNEFILIFYDERGKYTFKMVDGEAVGKQYLDGKYVAYTEEDRERREKLRKAILAEHEDFERRRKL